MFSNYFHPVSDHIIDFKNTLNQNQIGFHVNCFNNNLFPDLNNTDIAIILVPENRASLVHVESVSFHKFRKSFYGLFKGNWDFRITDFGDLKLGNDLKDTYFVLNDIVSHLLSQSIFPIILGGTNDLIYPVYQSYESFSKGVNLLCIDSKFDLIDENPSNINSRNYIGHILKKEINHLHHYTNLGYQSYLCQHDEANLLEKMFFESMRLGDLRENIKEAEPYLRSSDIVSLDLTVIKQSDAPGTSCPSPNGLESHHVCILSRYAGMSDRVSSFGVFELDDSRDPNDQTVKLISQIIWYFLEGYSLRSNDYPNAKTINSHYLKYLVPVKDTDFQFVFYKSKNTSRWWVSSCLEFNDETNYYEKLLPCSYEDYLSVTSGDIPKRIQRILKST